MGGRGIAKIMFIFGILLIIISFIEGEAKVGIFFFIFPFIYGTGLFLFFGVLLIMISIILFLFSFPEIENVEVKKGGMLLIGPIPIIISDDMRLSFLMLILAIIFLAIFFLFLFIKF